MARGLQRTLARAASRALGTQPGVSGLKREITGYGGQYQVTLTFTDMLIPVTDALAYASQKLLDLPDGRAYIKGGIASLKFGVTTDRTATINDSAAMDWSVGTVAASSITLASTMVDIVAKQDHTLDGATTAYTALVNANVAAAAFHDGATTAAKDVYLNVGFPTNTEIDADGILKVSGRIVLNIEMMGDYAAA